MMHDNKTISPLRYVLTHLKRDRLGLALALFWSLLFVIIPMQIPILTGALINAIHKKPVKIYGLIDLTGMPAAQVIRYAFAGMIIIGALYGISAYFKTSCVARVSRHFVSELRKLLVEKLEALSLDVHALYGPAELLNRAILDTQTLRPIVESTVIKTSVNFLRLAYPIVMLFLISPYLTLLAISVLPVDWLITRSLHKKLHVASRRATTSQAVLVTNLKENLDGMETVQTSNAQDYLMSRIFEQAEQVEKDQISTQKYSGIIAGVVWALTTAGMALVWWQGGLKALAGEMTVGTLVTYAGLAAFLYDPLRNFKQAINAYLKGVVAAERIQEIVDVPSSINELPDAADLVIANGRIHFKNVSFSYSLPADEKTVPGPTRDGTLSDINVVIEPNTLTGIVGRSGSGKSTILKMITRLYDPTEGQILIDGQDIKQVTLDSLRSRIAVVPQTPIIFSGTVAENIRIVKPDVSDREVKAALKQAGALGFVEALRKGIGTHLGQGGISLSGGETQRIAIARALVRKPKILLLDEPSSALDTESETALMATLDRLKPSMTIIMVGHHIQAIRQADRLMVMENGRIVEAGSHEELLGAKGIYRLLYLQNDKENDHHPDA
ncbi:ABC transporter ATP-binding protein [bacterium]|nr:MAG: ABC transporter ATP-binding protein [bacterium]